MDETSLLPACLVQIKGVSIQVKSLAVRNGLKSAHLPWPSVPRIGPELVTG
jgi:hypothetical protein